MLYLRKYLRKHLAVSKPPLVPPVSYLTIYIYTHARDAQMNTLSVLFHPWRSAISFSGGVN